MLRPYYHFLKDQWRVVSFGGLITFFSSFGQTFLISLFVPAILSDLALTKTVFGSYYTIATLISSVCLLFFGHIIDEQPVRPFTYKTLFLLGTAIVLLGSVWHPFVLFIALVGLRFGGQGLMSHISMSVMTRYFEKHRGKALSLSSLGFSVGEMVFPLLIGGGLALAGWRWTAICSVTLLVGLWSLLHFMDLENLDSSHPESTTTKMRGLIYGSMLREDRFWIIALPVGLLSYLVTGFFFYQYVMAETKGWPKAYYTFLFTGYGGVRLCFSLFGGILTDRFSGYNLFPYYLLPLTLGVLGLGLLPGLWAGAIFLLGTGITMGVSGIVKSSLYAEMYGTKRIGKVRSLFTVIMIIGTALAPMSFGMALDADITFEQIALTAATLLSLVTLNSFRIRWYRPN